MEFLANPKYLDQGHDDCGHIISNKSLKMTFPADEAKVETTTTWEL